MIAQLGKLVSNLPSTAKSECPYRHCFQVWRLSFTHVSFPKALLATVVIKVQTIRLTTAQQSEEEEEKRDVAYCTKIPC